MIADQQTINAATADVMDNGELAGIAARLTPCQEMLARLRVIVNTVIAVAIGDGDRTVHANGHTRWYVKLAVIVRDAGHAMRSKPKRDSQHKTRVAS